MSARHRRSSQQLAADRPAPQINGTTAILGLDRGEAAGILGIFSVQAPYRDYGVIPAWLQCELQSQGRPRVRPQSVAEVVGDFRRAVYSTASPGSQPAFWRIRLQNAGEPGYSNSSFNCLICRCDKGVFLLFSWTKYIPNDALPE